MDVVTPSLLAEHIPLVRRSFDILLKCQAAYGLDDVEFFEFVQTEADEMAMHMTRFSRLISYYLHCEPEHPCCGEFVAIIDFIKLVTETLWLIISVETPGELFCVPDQSEIDATMTPFALTVLSKYGLHLQ